MNNLSSINNAPGLVQEIARQVSAIATMIGKAAFAALAYFVATLQAIPPLLPLMIVVVAGVTIAAVIIRNVLYPDKPQNTPDQNIKAGSKNSRTGPGRRKTRPRELPKYNTYMTGRIKKPIDRRPSSGSEGQFKEPLSVTNEEDQFHSSHSISEIKENYEHNCITQE